MTDIIDPEVTGSRLNLLSAVSSDSGSTPAGLQSRRSLTMRRYAMLTLNLVTLGAIMYGIVQVFGGDGLDLIEMAILACISLSFSVCGSPRGARRPNLFLCLLKRRQPPR